MLTHWSRAMAYESIDAEHDVMIVKCFFSVSRADEFPRNISGNQRNSLLSLSNLLQKKHLDKKLSMDTLLGTEMTSKCSKLYSETIRLHFAVPLEF